MYKLLAAGGAADRRNRMYASGGVEYAWYKRPEDLINEAVGHRDESYTAFKFRIGTEWRNRGMTLARYIPFVRKMREAVGPNFD